MDHRWRWITDDCRKCQQQRSLYGSLSSQQRLRSSQSPLSLVQSNMSSIRTSECSWYKCSHIKSSIFNSEQRCCKMWLFVWTENGRWTLFSFTWYEISYFKYEASLRNKRLQLCIQNCQNENAFCFRFSFLSKKAKNVQAWTLRNEWVNRILRFSQRLTQSPSGKIEKCLQLGSYLRGPNSYPGLA